MSERLSTGIILVNELHYLALEERLGLITANEPEILDKLPITRLAGATEKKENSLKLKGVEPWEQKSSSNKTSLRYDYVFWNPEHDGFDLQKCDEKYLDEGFKTCPIEFLEIQVDVFPEDRDIYRIGFERTRLPLKSKTKTIALERIEHLRKRYGLYHPLKSGDEDHTRMWLGRLYALGISVIRRGPKEAMNGYWKTASDVTEKYLDVDIAKTGQFFPRLLRLTGGIIQWAYKTYDTTQRGWVLDGLVQQLKAPL